MNTSNQEYVLIGGRIVDSTPRAYQIWHLGNLQWFPKWSIRQLNKMQLICRADIAEEKGVRILNEHIEFEEVVNSPQFIANPVYHTTPYEHQIKALDKMLSIERGFLFMEMGTGKTKVAIDLAISRNASLLVVCPTTVKHHFEAQIWFHGYKGNYLIVGSENLSSSIKGYDAAIKFLEANPVTQLVIDEVHQFKNANIKRSERIEQISSLCAYAVGLTGTPITQSVGDLWGIFKSVSPHKSLMGIPSQGKFESQHLVFGQRKKVIGYRNLEPLIEKIQPQIFDVKKSQCLDLPPKTYQTRTCFIGSYAQEAYDEAKSKWLEVYEKTKSANAILAMFTELQKVVTLDNQNKLQELKEIIEEAQDRVVVWCKYTMEIQQIKDYLSEYEVFVLNGSTPQSLRGKLIEDWSSSAKGIMVANLQTGGYGIELTASSTCIYYSNSFKYSDRIQSEDRLHRIGQSKSVTYIDLFTDTKMDQIVHKCVMKKKNLADYINELISLNQPIDL